MSDHETDADDLPPWMCSEVERRMGFYRRQFLLLLVMAAASGFALNFGVIGFLAFIFGLLLTGGILCGEVTDALTDAAWYQHEHEYEKQR